MVSYAIHRSQLPPMGDVGIVSERHNPSLWNPLRKKTFGPGIKSLTVSPCFLSVTSKAVDEDDAKIRK